MEFPTDAKFSNIELAPNPNAKGVLYVPVKNNYQTYEPFAPLSVFDKHPDIVGKYRNESVLRYNELREAWEINPYFLESNFLSAPVQEPVDDSEQDDIEIPQITVENLPIELQGEGTVHSITVTLDKPYFDGSNYQDVTLTVSKNPISSTYFIDFSDVDLTFTETVLSQTFTLTEKANVDLTQELNDTVTGFTVSETTSFGINYVTFDVSVKNDTRVMPNIAFVDNFSSTNFEDVNSALVPTIIEDFSGFVQDDIIYTLYSGTQNLGLSPAFTENDTTWRIVSKDLITVQGEFAYALLQIRGITVLTSTDSGFLNFDDLRFALLRQGVFYELELLQNSGGLTQSLPSQGISKTFEQNLYNSTIEMGNVDYFLRFNTPDEPAQFVLQLAQQSSLLLMKNSTAKMPTMQRSIMETQTLNSLVDNNIYVNEVIDSWMYFDENQYANPIAFYSTVKVANHVIITPGDMLAAYIIDSTGNTQIRGVTRTDYNTTNGQGVIPWVYPGESEAVNILETTVFTNALKSTEFIKFRLFKKDPFVLDGKVIVEGNSVYELAQELPVGGINGLTGGMYSEGPSNANIFYIGRFTTVLNGPYDDFSFNITMESSVKEHVFVNGSVSVLDKIKAYRSQDYTAVQVAPGVWLSNTMSNGSLFVDAPLSFKEFYSVRLMPNVNTVTLNVDGFPVKTQVPIALKPGYNWIGYTMFRRDTLHNVFKLDTNDRLSIPSSLKAIITRSEGSALVNNGQFFGSLEYMKPGGAYVLYIDQSLPSDTTVLLNYPSTYNTTTIQSPNGYFKVDSFINPIPSIIGDIYIYISDTELGLAFTDPNDSTKIAGLKTTGNYTGFGVHDTTMTLIDPQSIKITNLGDIIPSFVGLDGLLTSIQLKAGFTTLDGKTVNGANGVLDFVLRKNPDPLSFSDTEAVDYVMSTIGGLFEDEQKPPFEFTATITYDAPQEVQDFIGNFIPVQPEPPENPVVFTLTHNVFDQSILLQMSLNNIVGTDATSKFHAFEIAFDGVDFGAADENPSTTDNVEQIDPIDKVTVLSPPSLGFDILQAQGNSIQYIRANGTTFGTEKIILKVSYFTAPENITIDKDHSLIAVVDETVNDDGSVSTSSYGSYTIPEFNNVVFNDDGLAVSAS